MGRKWLAWLLMAAILLSLPVIALGEAQAKSWDKKGEHIYGLMLPNDGNLTAADNGKMTNLSRAYLMGAGKYPKDMYGTWSAKHIGGDDIELSISSDGCAVGAKFNIDKGSAGQSAVFMVTFSSEELVNDVCSRLNVLILPKDNEYANDYAYDKTEHTFKTGKRFHVDGGHTLPVGAKVYRKISIYPEYSEITADNKGWIEFDEATGEFTGCIRQPGTYKLYVWPSFMDNVGTEVIHTITVEGEPTDEDLPDEFGMWLDRDETTRLYVEGDEEKYITSYHLLDDWAWRNDKIEWSFEQTKGEKADFFGRNDAGDNCNGQCFVKGPLPIGEYEFKVSAKNVTRSGEASVSIKVTVEEREGEKLPGTISYKKIKDGATITLKVGKTLKFGKPKLSPSGAKLPEDHIFGVVVDDFEGNWDIMCAKEDNETGAHILKGEKEGTYKVHAYLSMYGESRWTEVAFTLNVVSAGAKAESLAFDMTGDWDNPYPLVVGSKLKIKPTILPKNTKVKALRWYSEDEDIASVNNKGVITGHMANQDVRITAVTTDGTNIEQSIVVRVIKASATKISMPKKLSLAVGDSATLEVKFKPANLPEDMKQLVWASEDTSIVEVNRSSGLITANSPGTVTIYAYPVDGMGWTGTWLGAKCKVTVK